MKRNMLPTRKLNHKLGTFAKQIKSFQYRGNNTEEHGYFRNQCIGRNNSPSVQQMKTTMLPICFLEYIV